MTKLLIADNSKAGLVMSTEVFKEKIPGISISVAKDGSDFLRMLPIVNPDIGIVDFDLPDVDGSTLIRYAKNIFDGPILLTAYLDDRIRKAIHSELFAFEDAGNCIEKPVKFDELAKIIDKFLVSKKRVLKRFDIHGDLELLGSSEPKNKTNTMKIKGKLVNISLGGACLQYEQATLRNLPEGNVTLSMKLPSTSAGKNLVVTKLPGKTCWINEKKRMIGIKFSQLSEPQKQGLEDSLRVSAGICEL